jgi:cytochrome oxidase Cu insertion factor (SCO1/SenC/PrrC family)
MPGMNTGLNADDPTVVAAFKLALLHQGIAAVLLFAVLALAWVSVREFLPARRSGADRAAASGPEAPARRLLRIGFGVLWIIDGLLQAQPGMAVGLPSQVIQPTAVSSPTWVQHLVNWAGTSWSYHPIQAAAGAVWIQLGIGIWLVLARRGAMSRLAGLSAAGWGLVVWVFGESFGGIFAPGLSWLTGAPGAAACYVIAGLLVALPERHWQSQRTGRLMLNCFGVFLVAMALLQAWPGRGFWQGNSHGQPGALTAMIQSMAAQSQPTGIADLLSGFASVVRSHGFAVNLLAVVVLAALGVGLGSARPALARVALIGLAVFGLADWVLVQDLGVLGGLGTDPNSMIPMFLLAAAGFQALTAPVVSAAAAMSPAAVTAAEPPAAEPPAAEPAGGELAAGDPPAAGPATADPSAGAAVAGAAAARPGQRQTWRRALRPARLLTAFASARLATVTALGAVGVVLLGAIPMAAAQASNSAAPILAQAVDGSSAPLNSPAPGFTLTDQSGKTVSLASLHGKAVLLTFLDPVCVSDCPLIAQEFREAAQLLAGQRSHVELVAVNLNPLYRGASYLRAFDQAEHLAGLSDWEYLTGSVAQLRPVWKSFGVVSETLPAGAMLGHSDAAFVIGPDGRLLEELDFDPGPGTQATVASFATELANAAQSALGQS